MPDAINARIIKYRKEKKFSQKEFARKLGCNYTTYSQREREGTFHATEVLKIADILGINCLLLLYDKIPDDMPPLPNKPKIPTEPVKKPIDKTFLVVDKLPRYRDPNIEENALECIIGYKLLNQELSVMEANFIKMLRNLPDKNIKKLFTIMRELEK